MSCAHAGCWGSAAGREDALGFCSPKTVVRMVLMSVKSQSVVSAQPQSSATTSAAHLSLLELLHPIASSMEGTGRRVTLRDLGDYAKPGSQSPGSLSRLS